MSEISAERAISLDYAASDDAVVIDQGIRDTIKGMRLSILSAGISLARIKSEGLFKDLDFKSMGAYINWLCEDTKAEAGSLKRWLRIGEAYIKYRSELELIGFSDQDGPTKLPFLDRALEKGNRDEVFSNLKNMSYRDFTDFVSSQKSGERGLVPFMEIRGNTFYLGGKRAVILNKSLGRKNTKIFKAAIQMAFRALERKSTVVAVHLRNANEARQFKIAAQKLRQKIQSRAQGKVDQKPSNIKKR